MVFFSQFKPSEPFLVDFLVSKGFTNKQARREKSAAALDLNVASTQKIHEPDIHRRTTEWNLTIRVYSGRPVEQHIGRKQLQYCTCWVMCMRD
jgi:hypothetical protein